MLDAATEKVILVVDANIVRQVSTQKILNNAGYKVLSASSAAEVEALCDTEGSSISLLAPW